MAGCLTVLSGLMVRSGAPGGRLAEIPSNRADTKGRLEKRQAAKWLFFMSNFS